MKKLFQTLVLVLATAGITNAQLDRSIRPVSGEAPQPKIGNAESFVMENGMKVFVVENDKLPRVSASLILNYDPIIEGDKAGYVSFAGDMLRRGTANRTKSQLDEEIDFMGARLNAGASSVSGGALSKYTDKLFELMADVTLNPSWNQDEFEKIRTQALSGLESSKDDPNAINSQVYRAIAYGKKTAFGEMMTKETVENITIDDCKNFYGSYFKPNIAYMAIVGDITVKEAKALMTKYFGSWEKGDVPAMEPYVAPTFSAPQVALINRDASVQSVIQIGNTIDLKPGSEDIAAMSVMNNILGGGMSGRLFINLREDKAFTYGAYSSFNTSLYRAGFSMSAEVRNEVTDSAIVEFLNELNRIRTTIPTDKEMKMAKSLLSGNFGRSLESPSTIARFAINMDRYNLPADYYNNYLSRIEAVTKEDVQKVAEKYCSINNTLICVTGKGSEVAESLKKFGAFQYYDMYANVAEAPMMDIPEGVTAESIVNNFIAAVGGEKPYKKLKSYESKMELTIPGMPMAAEMVVAVDLKKGYLYQNMSAGGQTFNQVVFDGTTAKQSGMGGSKTLEGEELEDVKRQTKTALTELNYLDGSYTLNVVGATKEEGQMLYILEVTTPGGKVTTEYYNAETGLKYKEVSSEDTPQGPMTATMTILEYKEVKGIKVPSKMVQSAAGQNIEINMVYYNPNEKFNKEYLTK